MKECIPPSCSTFRFQENPLLFDRTTGRLHLLNSTSGFIWDHLSTAPTSFQLAKKYAAHFGISLTQAHRDITETLANLVSLGLLNPTSSCHPVDLSPEDPQAKIEIPSGSVSDAVCFCFYRRAVHLRCHIPKLAARILPLFAHLPAAQKTAIQAATIDLFGTDGSFYLLHNGTVVLGATELDSVLSHLKTVVTEACHSPLEWLAAIHCAAVADDRGALLMPGKKGAGKSTLCAALVHSGYDFVTDDLAMLALPDISLTVSPFPMALKKGSWKVLKSFCPQLDTLPVHANGLSQQLRYLAPPRLAARPTIPVRAIVLPSYRPNRKNTLEPASSLEALMVLSTEAGFEIEAAKIEIFLTWLSRIPIYSLSYRSLENARELVGRI